MLSTLIRINILILITKFITHEIHNYINRLTATKVDSTYLGRLTSNAQRICDPVVGLERMTTGSVAKRLTLSRHTSRQLK